MKILITGGAGFIGSALVRHLIATNAAHVLSVDKLTYAGNLESLAVVDGSPRYRFVRLDICNKSAMTNVVETFGPTAIVHLAAESHVDRSIDGPEAFLRTNLFGTGMLLEVALSYWRRLGDEERRRFRLLHVSTDEVYGDLGQSNQLFTETTPYSPGSPYAATKAGADHLVRAWGRTYGLPTLITNCSNNFGPYQFPEKLIPHIVINALHGRSLPVYGDGNQVRDWLFVDDHVRALMCVLATGRVGETYNIGGRNQQTNIDLVRKICAILQREVPQASSGRSFLKLIEFVKDRPGHDRRYGIDAGKIERELGWRPCETFDTALEETVLWYLKNEPWWRSVLNRGYRLERIGAAASR